MVSIVLKGSGSAVSVRIIYITSRAVDQNHLLYLLSSGNIKDIFFRNKNCIFVLLPNLSENITIIKGLLMIGAIGRIPGISIILAASLFFASSANAATVWAVDKGADAGTGAAGTPLELAPGDSGIDLYMESVDRVFGWDFTLNVVGPGSIQNVSGAFLDLGVGLANGGIHQQGGETTNGQTGLFLAMSFDFLGADNGSMIEFFGKFTNSSFADIIIAPADSPIMLAQVQVVPIPAAAWLMGSALVGLVGFGRSRKAMKF